MTVHPIDTAPRARVRTLADVEPQRVEWLWPGRLPAGKLVVIDGDPSAGKSTLTLDMAARVSTGRPWPDGAPCPIGDVLLLSAEDGLADTIRPRLDAAGANVARVHALTEVTRYDDDGRPHQSPPTLPNDLPVIADAIAAHGVRLVIIDVLMAYLARGVDSHRDQDVRGVLHRLAAIADQTGATVVLIRHMSKAGGASPLYRGGGSIGIIGAARAGFLVARDPDDETGQRRIFAVIKSNLAVEPPSLAYRLVSDPDHGCARVEWEDTPTDHTAADLLRAERDDDGQRSEADEALEFIRGYLLDAGGSAPARDVLKAGHAAGFAESVLKKARARKGSGVATARQGFGPGATWVWTIDSPIDSIGSPFFRPEPMEPMGTYGGQDAPTGRSSEKAAETRMQPQIPRGQPWVTRGGRR